MLNLRVTVLTAVTILAASLPGRADLVNSQVTGSLSFGTSANYFDPHSGYVPAGYANDAGPTVTIGSSGTEFGFADPWLTLTADFTGDSLTVTDSGLSGSGWTMTFTDSAFSGATLTQTSDTFTNLGPAVLYSLTGDVLTVSWAGIAGEPQSDPGTVITFGSASVAAVPEPPVTGFLALMVLGAVWQVSRRHKRASS